MPDLFIGIDLGTSGCRAIAINTAADIIAQANTTLPAPAQSNNHIEQDAELWWQALTCVLENLLQQCDPSDVKAISIDGTSGTVLLADINGHPLHPALMYNDARATTEVEKIKRVAPIDSVVHSSSSGLAKLLWLQQQDFSSRGHYFCHQADWIVGKLTGQFGFSDSNNSLKTGYDPVNHCWPEWLDKLIVNREWLPEVKQPGSLFSTVSKSIAEQFNLNKQCRIIAGTTDSTASFLATGATQVGEAVTTLGSTLVLKVISSQPVSTSDYGIYSQPLPDLTGSSNPLWLCGGASNCGGAVLRQHFSDEQMVKMESQLTPDINTGLDYYPLANKGERFPVNDPELKPRLTPRPDNDVMFFQGILESLARIETDGYQKLEQCGAPYPTTVRTSGGGAKNKIWSTMREQQLKIPVISATHTEAAYGAALLARYGATKST
ncbi:MAG: FGGY-family carbohydrate kinase [Gammaproteobacteria bacterium]|nr:FGGY-family carbohydrate kinase [Gammaproteobacteria bacterium]